MPNYRDGIQPRPSTENWIKNVLSTLKVYPKAQIPPQPVPNIRILPQASYPYPSKGTQNENHNHRKLTKLITWITALSNSMKLWAKPPKTDGLWWRVLTKRDPLEKGMASHFSLLALRWKERKIQAHYKEDLPCCQIQGYIIIHHYPTNSIPS